MHDSPLEPADHAWLAQAFPFSPPVGRVGKDMHKAIINRLPRMAGARNLADIYFKHAAWMCVSFFFFSDRLSVSGLE
jgi:hypothetical protein